MKSRSNIERTSNKKLFVSRLLYSLLAVVLSVLLFPLSSFATHSKVFLESAETLGGNARFAYAATPQIQPSTGDTLSIAVTYDLLHIIKDHLGSIRAILTSDGNIRDRHDYYPFGLRTDQSRAYPTLSDRYTVKVPRLTQGPNGTIIQTGYRSTAPYTQQYNGKELQLLANTTLIDYGARQYNPTLARWTAQDPMAEKYYGLSPYAYCAGNPILLIDKEGKHPLLWIAASVLIDYGIQVYNNYDLGKSGSDAWWGDINMVSLAASAIPITGYAQMTKMMGINLLDAIVKYTPNDGLTIETSAKKILKTAAIHTIGATAGKQVTKASSKTSVQKVSKEVKEANKAVRKAKRNVEKHPNSAKKVEQQKSAEINAQNARKKEVVVKTLNSTIGQAPKATEEASKAAAKAYTYEKDKED